MVVLSEQPRRFLTWGKRHCQIADQATATRPLKEITHGPAGGSTISEPLIQLRQRAAQGMAAVVQPAQQVEGSQDASPGEVRSSSAEGPAGGGTAGTAEHEPVREGPDQPGMVSRFIAQQTLQPGRQTLQVLVARRQNARVDQHFPDVVQGLSLRQVIEQVVGDRGRLSWPGGRATGLTGSRSASSPRSPGC
jgi:hypothetical protein